jgi:hypothetical protein
MRFNVLLPVTAVALLGAASTAYAQSIYEANPNLFPGYPNKAPSSPLVEQGSGAVKPLGPGQNRNTSGIGGSATTAPRAAPYTPSVGPNTTGSVTGATTVHRATAPHQTRRMRHRQNMQPG